MILAIGLIIGWAVTARNYIEGNNGIEVDLPTNQGIICYTTIDLASEVGEGDNGYTVTWQEGWPTGLSVVAYIAVVLFILTGGGTTIKAKINADWLKFLRWAKIASGVMGVIVGIVAIVETQQDPCPPPGSIPIPGRWSQTQFWFWFVAILTVVEGITFGPNAGQQNTVSAQVNQNRMQYTVAGPLWGQPTQHVIMHQIPAQNIVMSQLPQQNMVVGQTWTPIQPQNMVVGQPWSQIPQQNTQRMEIVPQ